MYEHLPVYAPLTLFPNFAKKWEWVRCFPIFQHVMNRTLMDISILPFAIKMPPLLKKERQTDL